MRGFLRVIDLRVKEWRIDRTPQYWSVPVFVGHDEDGEITVPPGADCELEAEENFVSDLPGL